MKIPLAVIILSASALNAQTAAYQFSNLSGTETKLLAVEPLAGQVVTGRPFSAMEERHSLQVLGDGTRIETSSTNHVFRDDQGRTRIERPDGTATITDPVAGFTAQLDTNARTYDRNSGLMALKTPMIYSYTTPNADALRNELAKRQAEMAQSSGASVARTNELRARIEELEKRLAEQKQLDERSIVRGQLPTVAMPITRAQTNTLSLGAVAISTGDMNGPITLRVDPGNNASVESLPVQSINGAMAQGTRTTETIPAGKIGNDRPINITSERWFSDDLKMLVKSASSDPRFGNTTYELTNIVQTSPDPSLFQIPANYTSKPSTFRFTVGRPN